MTTDEAFEEQCFLWERGASIGADFDLFNFHDLLPIQNTEGQKKRKRYIKPLFNMFYLCNTSH